MAKGDRTASASDRFEEAHYWLHMMERHYHSADLFRWHLNVFLKALKEVPAMIGMAAQTEPGFAIWFRGQRAALGRDPLIRAFHKGRDQVVHREMLVPGSRAEIGVTEGRGMKLGMGFPIDPLADSDDGMDNYLWYLKRAGQESMADFLGVLVPDEDSLPCVRREWRLEGFDEELIDLCARAWLRTGELLEASVRRLGHASPSLDLSCRETHQAVLYKTYDRAALVRRMAEMPPPGPGGP